MSRRIAEANKAIAEAWEREQQLVSDGKGTRGWTQKQQHDILERGKAYDSDGKALEGHHMKNVANFPDYQGIPDNIQFLSRAEHLDAHGGSYQNSTNGYFNPTTRETVDFGLDELNPCEVIDLTDPIITPEVKYTNESEKGSSKVDTERNDDSTRTRPSSNNEQSKRRVDTKGPNTAQVKKTVSKHIEESFYKALHAVQKFDDEHPILSVIVKTFGTVAAEYAISAGVSKALGGSHSGSGTGTSSGFHSSKRMENKADVILEALEKKERASPIKHNVSGYTRDFKGREIHVDPYERGGRNK